MLEDNVQGRQLVAQALPWITSDDAVGLAAMLGRDWTEADLVRQLVAGESDAAKVAVACLATTGTIAVNRALARTLHHDDSATVTLAEHALWAIWFRAGSPKANTRLRRAIRLMNRSDRAEAVAVLTEIIAAEPDFAEAYNQRAICHHLDDQPALSIVDCNCALERNPYHFGAMAGCGHSYAQLGQYAEAMACYRAALTIHPRLDGIRQSIRCLRRLTPHHQPGTAA